jgi:DNA-binding NarL/FixJ family response regulator
MLSSSLQARGIAVIGEFATASEAASIDASARPNVALLDLHLGKGPTGLDVAISLRQKNPDIGLVFLTSFEDPRLLSSKLPALPSNARYLTKTKVADVDTLISTLTDAAIGRPSKTATKADSNPLVRFTNTQIETLHLVAQGLSNAEISKRRFVTERSVEISIARIAKSLGLAADATRNQRVHMARVYFRAMGRPPIDED